MQCNQDKIILFWSGELEREDAQLVKEHLKKCPSCRESLEGLNAVESQIQEIPVPLPTRDFAGDAVAVAYKQRDYTFVWNDRVLLAIAAGIICVLGLGLLWSLRRHPSGPAPATDSYARILVPPLQKGRVHFFSFSEKPEEQVLRDRMAHLEQDITALRKDSYITLSTIDNKDVAAFQGQKRIWKLRGRVRALRASI